MALYGHMMHQRVLASHSDGSTDDYGQRIFTDEAQIKCRVELVNKSKQNAAGELVPIMAKIWFDPSLPYDAGDKLIYREQAYQVVSRTDIPDGTGKTQLVMTECMEWRA